MCVICLFGPSCLNLYDTGEQIQIKTTKHTGFYSCVCFAHQAERTCLNWWTWTHWARVTTVTDWLSSPCRGTTTSDRWMKVLQKKGRSRVKTCRGKLKYAGVPDTHETQPRYKGIHKQNRILNKNTTKTQQKRQHCWLSVSSLFSTSLIRYAHFVSLVLVFRQETIHFSGVSLSTSLPLTIPYFCFSSLAL